MNWTKLPTVCDHDWLPADVRKTGRILTMRVEELRQIRENIDTAAAELAATPTSEFGASQMEQKRDISMRQLQVLQEEAAIRADLRDWYGKRQAGSRAAADRATADLEAVKQQVDTALQGIGYRHEQRVALGIDQDMIGRHPSVREARARITEISPWRQVQDDVRENDVAMARVEQEAERLREKLLQLV